MLLGDIIAVSGIRNYVVKVPNDGNGSEPPLPKPGPGAFVSIKAGKQTIIGVVTGITATIKEDFLPYISPEKQPRYMPYNEDYRNCYLEVRALGTLGQDRIPNYRILRIPEIKDAVELATPDAVESFHMKDGKPSLGYLNTERAELPKEAVAGILESLEDILPDSESNRLALVKRYMEREAGK